MELRSRSIQQVTQNVIQVLNETSLSSLPLEVLEHIFSFLNRDDLLQAMSVCTTWKSLIFSTPNLWRSQTFIFDCSLRFKKKEKVDMLFCTQNFGPHIQTLSVRCRHPDVLDCYCYKMAKQFHLFLTGLKLPELTSFKVYDLQLDYGDCPNIKFIKQISRKLNNMLSSVCLKVFKMPDARWPETDGQEVLYTVFENSGNTLETLNISEYFYGEFFLDLDWFETGLTSLKKLTKLSISIYYLTDELIVSLARVRRGQLAHLSLTADLEFTDSLIKQDSWKCLLEECPNIKVSFKIVGYVEAPHEYFTEILDSILPVTKLKIILRQDSYLDDLPITDMEIVGVLEHVRTHYGPSLKSITLVLNNKKEETFDQSLINLVRDCPHLTLVETSVSYYSEDTVKTINRIVAKRRQPPLTSMGPRNKKVCTDSLVGEKASEREDSINRQFDLQGASQQ